MGERAHGEVLKFKWCVVQRVTKEKENSTGSSGVVVKIVLPRWHEGVRGAGVRGVGNVACLRIAYFSLDAV